MSADDHDSLIETIDILSNNIQVELIKEGLRDIQKNDSATLKEVRAEMMALSRLK